MIPAWRPSLGEHLFADLAPSLAHRTPLGEYEVPLGAAIFGGAWVFAHAALIGRARSDRLDAIGALLRVAPAAPDGALADAMRELARATVAELKAAPASLLEFWLASEFPAVAWSEERLASVAHEHMPLRAALDSVNLAAVSGAALGATFPDAVEFLWRGAQQQSAPWSRAIAAGIAIDKTPETASLDDAQSATLANIATLVAQHYPELGAAFAR